MSGKGDQQELLSFPCHFEFKAFGPGGEGGDFFSRVHAAVCEVIAVPLQAMKARPSSGGRYQCVTALVTLQNRDQLDAIYASLRQIDDLKYLL
jgi:putative lipoic acid-binding regulatory protein